MKNSGVAHLGGFAFVRTVVLSGRPLRGSKGCFDELENASIDCAASAWAVSVGEVVLRFFRDMPQFDDASKNKGRQASS